MDAMTAEVEELPWPLMRRLADERKLTAWELARASDDALELLSHWCDAGWAHTWAG